MLHIVGILALDGVISFDLATPIEAFERVRGVEGQPVYEVRVCSMAPQIDAGAFMLHAPWTLADLAEADTIFVPGLADPMANVPPEALAALRHAAARGARIASICVGAFTLAATGLLNGLRATTHWAAAEELARRFPEVEVDANVLFVDNGQFLTSAGAAAGLDLCLHIIRCDHGAAVAANAARSAVMPLERDGGQAQFIMHEPPAPTGMTLAPVLEWIEANAGDDVTLDAIAMYAQTSTRTLNRRFRQQLGTTPLQWLIRVRLHQAQTLLETTDHTIERIATIVGFGSPTAFRDHFRQYVGTSPYMYRRAFRSRTT